MSKVVRAQSKGMVTIPTEYRKRLGIEGNCLMEVKIVDESIVLTKVRTQGDLPEIYTDAQIDAWVKEDKIDAEIQEKLRKLLK